MLIMFSDAPFVAFLNLIGIKSRKEKTIKSQRRWSVIDLQ